MTAGPLPASATRKRTPLAVTSRCTGPAIPKGTLPQPSRAALKPQIAAGCRPERRARRRSGERAVSAGHSTNGSPNRAPQARPANASIALERSPRAAPRPCIHRVSCGAAAHRDGSPLKSRAHRGSVRHRSERALLAPSSSQVTHHCRSCAAGRSNDRTIERSSVAGCRSARSTGGAGRKAGLSWRSYRSARGEARRPELRARSASLSCSSKG